PGSRGRTRRPARRRPRVRAGPALARSAFALRRAALLPDQRPLVTRYLRDAAKVAGPPRPCPSGPAGRLAGRAGGDRLELAALECPHRRRADVPERAEPQHRRGEGLAVRRLEHAHEVVAPGRPPDVLDLDVQTGEELLRRVHARRRLLVRLDALVGPVEQHDVGGHALPSRSGYRERFNTNRLLL